MNFTVLDLFSGIGGFSLGLERAGMQTIAFCENDSFCQKVLRKHWPNLPIHENIEELDGRQYRGTVDLVCGGFPCQPFSVAGKRGGKDDDRALWPEMLRVIREVEPAWAIGENVSGIIHMELDNVLSDLEGAGYSCQSFVIPACGVDAQHKRDRVWIIASHAYCSSRAGGDETVADADINDRRRGRIPQPPERYARMEHWFSGSGQSERETKSPMADSHGTGFQKQWLENTTRTAHEAAERGSSRGTQSRMGGMADGVSRWLDEPGGIPRVIEGCPDQVGRLKSLGNAIVPQIVEILGRFILDKEAKTRGHRARAGCR